MRKVLAPRLKPRLRRCIAWGLAAGLLLAGLWRPFPAWADTNEVDRKTRQLEQLRVRINRLQQELEHRRDRKAVAVRRVREVEVALGKTVHELKRTRAQQVKLEEDLQHLHSERAALAATLDRQREQLASEVRGAYAMGRQHQIKLLLSQQQADQVGRLMTYYGYLSRARSTAIAGLESQIERMQLLEKSIAKRRLEAARLARQQQRARDELKQQMSERQAAVAALDRQLTDRGAKLARLERDAKALGTLIDSLRKVLADIPEPARQQGPLKARKGKLTWPARGRLKLRFGTRLPGTDLKSSGVLIQAPEGGKVRAVSHGRVAFADWIRGFGLLLILDHGGGYMSLYGHNQSLYKEVGEWVDSGDVIAALGRSGGYTTPGLYFEFRYRGQPVNPGEWCAGSPEQVSG